MLIRSVMSGAAGWQSMLRSVRFPSSARSLFDSGASACTRAGSLSVCHWRQNTSSATGSLAR